MFYVYEWYVVESGEIFYVGKGTRNRYKVRKHNKFFNDFITRYNCDSRIIKEFKTEKEAFEYEYERINELKCIGQCVCNIYEGGTGGTVEWWTEEKKEKYSKNNVMKSKKQRARMSANNPMKNAEIAKKVGLKHKKKICIGSKVYEGIIDVCKEYSVNSKAVSYWLERGYSREELPCYYYGQEIPNVVLRKHKANMKSVIVDYKEFESLKLASKYIGSKVNNLSTALCKGKTTYKGHSIRYGNQQPSQGKSDNSTLEGSTTNG